jgi:hypothetical protein
MMVFPDWTWQLLFGKPFFVEILKVEGIPWSISAGLRGHCEQVSICEESRLGAWEMERKVIHEP